MYDVLTNYCRAVHDGAEGRRRGGTPINRARDLGSLCALKDRNDPGTAGGREEQQTLASTTQIPAGVVTLMGSVCGCLCLDETATMERET